jgi:HK97 family phage prohead protease/HK97 family phage major capsid protein
MSNKIYQWTSTFKSLGETDDGGINIKGSASTNALDRAGDIIESEAWMKGGLENFKGNPIILFNHDYNKPIGRATDLQVTDKGLEITAKISKAAGDITHLVKDGVLGAFSVGFRCKDSEYMAETDGYKIKDAELFEVSVVSVPCNQGATFGLAKSFDSMEEYRKYQKQILQANSTAPADAVKIEQPSEEKSSSTETDMSEERKSPETSIDLEAFAKKVAEDTATKIAMKQAEQKAADEKAQAEAAEKQAEVEANEKAVQEAKEIETKTIVEAGLTGAERLMNDLETRVNQKQEDLKSVVDSLEKQLAEKSEEIMNIRESKRVFANRNGNGDWKKDFEQDVMDAKFAGLATGKGWDTDYAKSIMQKVNTQAGVEVSSANFEQLVSTSIERDIQNELVLAPLFREIQMNSANMIIPVLPDAGYAEFTSSQTAGGSNPKGNLEARGAALGANDGVDLTEVTLSTKKLISQSYLGNETEEDAIMPILPLIRESMVRAHARGIENAILAGDNAEGVYGTAAAAFEGLIEHASNGSYNTVDVGGGSGGIFDSGDALTAADLLGLRKNMGKYGVNPSEVVYLVSQEAYYNLLEDAEFQDANLVGDMATKLSGEIGQVFGSRVILCDEFASKAASKTGAIAVYPRNYVMPRLRGVTIESDYEVANQRRVLVASQRLGFAELIENAHTVHGWKYAAAS